MSDPKGLFFDGAFGTYYRALTGDDAPCELANLNAPETVVRIHRAYLRAGANALKTNTFCANPTLFAPEELPRVLSAALSNAREAMRAEERADVTIFADIGCIRGENRDAALDILQVAEAFLELGVEHYLFETQDDMESLRPAMHLLRAHGVATIVVSFAVSQDGYSNTGHYYAELIEDARHEGADVAGLNCVCGPAHMKRLLRALPASDVTLLAMPNAGYPSLVNGRLTYRDNPDYFAQLLAEIWQEGARAVGGCCGTTPAHIEKAIRRIARIDQRAVTPRVRSLPMPDEPCSDAPMQTSALEAALRRGEFVILAELNPPADGDLSFTLQAGRALLESGASALTVPDSPLARPRMSSFACAALLRRELGVEVIPHLTCRDRNRVAIKGTLLGGSALDIRNVLAITGDPITREMRREGEEAADKNVFSFSSQQLIGFIDSLNETTFARRPYYVAAALNVNAPSFDVELARAVKKEAAGAKCFLTQAIYRPDCIENLKRAKAALHCPLIAGIMPVASHRNAVFLNNEVHGISIPEEFVESLKDQSVAMVKTRSLAYARRLIDLARPYCDGIYLMMPLKKLDFVTALAEYIRGTTV